ncbi:enoyl-CoA hydratase [Amycolatopsis sp. WAC 04182]|uniref:enoyl-CoA hydratase-related protein n=1 Tax=Amycolatopsis sp. WAC 04182 TaxID=2203198 RepID=UPI000F7730B5|nr:enoyl-CoA hydratase-related protein [Amycolatopsis sp. WAC 04182]RSN54428.1 enoyl-CoA hydratase [Amycolatopsis sp. WAC 04182]
MTVRQWETLAVERTEAGDLDVVVRGTGEGNVLGGAFWTELTALTASLADERGCVFLRGAGDLFSRGLDLRWYLTRLRRATRRGDTTEMLSSDIRRLQQAITDLASCPRPVVAIIDGECAGAAFELVSACDLRFATERAWFSMPEADLGVVADLGGLQRLPRLAGEGVVRELALGGGRYEARRALRAGLVNDVAASMTAARDTARRFADLVRTKPPSVLAEVKRVLDQPHESALIAGLDRVATWNSEYAPSCLERAMTERIEVAR